MTLNRRKASFSQVLATSVNFRSSPSEATWRQAYTVCVYGLVMVACVCYADEQWSVVWCVVRLRRDSDEPWHSVSTTAFIG